MRILGAASLAGLLLLAGCSLFTKVKSEASPPEPTVPSDHSLTIPAAQLPAPGECRVWLPGSPPAQQTAAGSCTEVQKNVPAGAWVLFRSEEKPNVVAVNVYRSKWPKMVAETRYFDYWTGRLLRVE